MEWEYDVIVCDTHCLDDEVNHNLKLRLNQAGAEGWELICSIGGIEKTSHTRYFTLLSYLIFKRPSVYNIKTPT